MTPKPPQGKTQILAPPALLGLPTGVRPSSGAVMLGSDEAPMKSGASAHSPLAAPEDARTPALPRLWHVGGVVARCCYGIGPVLVRCRPDVDTVLINRTGPQMPFLTPCLALGTCNHPRIPPIDANCLALEPGRALPCSGCQLLIRVNSRDSRIDALLQDYFAFTS